MLAAAGLLVAVAGVPWLLYALGGGLPTNLPNAHQVHRFVGQPITDTALLRAVSLVCWAVWALFVAAFAAEAAASATRTSTPSQTGRGFRIPGLQGAAGAAFLTAMLLFPQRSSTSVAAIPTPVPLASPAVTSSLSITGIDLVARAGGRSPANRPRPRPRRPLDTGPGDRHRIGYTVKRYDTLWGIAEAHLGTDCAGGRSPTPKAHLG